MFFQEVSQQAQSSETLKILIGAVALILSNVVTFFFTRGKSSSEIAKNQADAHKSEADAAKSQIETIKLLHDELDEVLIAARGFRKDISTLEDYIDELKEAAIKVEYVYQEEKRLILIAVQKLTLELSAVIDSLISVEIEQVMRMKAVKILEALYSLKEKLES